MEQFLLIPAIVLLAIYCAFALKYELQMLQQNSYRIERYWKWVLNSFNTERRLVDILVLFLLNTPFTHWVMVSVVILYALIRIYTEYRKKYKKPLVFTKRATRLYITSLILAYTLPTIVYISTFNLYMSLNCLMLMIVISYAIIILATIVTAPMEKAINRHYYNDAKRILQEMPGLMIIGITGSYGKTSTKHYLYRILAEQFNVLMTPGSYNTTLGVIRTIREQLKPYHNVFIVEMGAKQIGDIKEICDLVQPSIGIVTAVGEQHLESFKNIQNVQRTKFELIDSLPAHGLGIINNDFEHIANRPVKNVQIKRYSLNDKETDYYVENIEYGTDETHFTIVGGGERLNLSTKLIGDCNISNLMAAVITARYLDVPENAIKYGVSRIEQVEHRLNMKRTPGGISIIDDAFNSNPDGSKMSLDLLKRITSGKRMIITPGMIELGEKQEFYNHRFGKQIAESCDYAIIVGTYNQGAILAGMQEAGMQENKIFLAHTFNDAQSHLQQIAERGDVVLYENDLPDTFK